MKKDNEMGHQHRSPRCVHNSPPLILSNVQTEFLWFLWFLYSVKEEKVSVEWKSSEGVLMW